MYGAVNFIDVEQKFGVVVAEKSSHDLSMMYEIVHNVINKIWPKLLTTRLSLFNNLELKD